MSEDKYTCETCGKEVGIGEWPYCPHGKDLHGMHRFKEYTDIAIDDHPVRITSLAQRRRLMKQKHLDYWSPGVGMPGCEV